MKVKNNVQRTKVDYIVVGLGVAGTWLAYELLKRGKTLLVINHDTENTSSKKAAGLYNPITGRNMIKTWRADDFFPDLELHYQEMESHLHEKFLYPKSIYRPFQTIAHQNDWQGRQLEKAYDLFIKEVKLESIGIHDVNDSYGGIIIDTCGYVDLPKLIGSYKNFLVDKGIYREEVFDLTDMSMETEGVRYKDLLAKKILFCEGTNPSELWSELPFKPVRGEIIDIDCNLPNDYIINQGVFIIPKNGFFTVGSTYHHDILTFEPQESGIEDIQRRLEKIFAGNYRILDKRAGVRPATHDRKPYIGFHKKFKTLGIFNGFGTKGVSLTPYFAKHFVDVLEENVAIEKEVDVARVY